MGFAHLHVASGFSMRHGASTPELLVERDWIRKGSERRALATAGGRTA